MNINKGWSLATLCLFHNLIWDGEIKMNVLQFGVNISWFSLSIVNIHSSDIVDCFVWNIQDKT